MRPIIAFTLCAILSGCARSRPAAAPAAASSSRRIVIRQGADGLQRDEAVGKWVRLEGVLTNDKQSQIAGVDVDEPTEPISGSGLRRVVRLRGKPAWAEGIIERTIVRPEEVDNTVANRGAGTFYRLVDPATGHTAEAHPAEGRAAGGAP